jgi:DNA-binding NtrC family response regulator
MSLTEKTQGSILVIEDDEMHLHALGGYLSDIGYEVYATADGPQGIELYKGHHPNVVLLELALPSMSGLEVLREIRKFDPAAKVIIVTGHGSVGSAVLVLRHGVLDYYEKANDLSLLHEKIQSAFNSVRD